MRDAVIASAPAPAPWRGCVTPGALEIEGMAERG